MPEPEDLVFCVATNGEHRYVMIADMQSLHLVASAVQDWVEDPELDFDETMRETLLGGVKTAVEAMRHHR